MHVNFIPTLTIIYMYTRITIMSALFMLFYSVLSQTVLASGACIPTYSYGTAVPAGYGTPYNLFSTAHELSIDAHCTATSDLTVNATPGATTENFYVYGSGYWWNGGSWQSYSFRDTANAPAAANGYIAGAAHSATVIPALATGPRYFVAYTCQTINNAWKCGCQNTACTTGAWQLQAATRGGGTDTGTKIPWTQLRGINGRHGTVPQMDAVNIKLVRGGAPQRTYSPAGCVRCTVTVNFTAYDAFLREAEAKGMRVVLDPHTFPGFHRGDTTFATDDFWTDERYYQNAADYWGQVAAHYKDWGNVIAGYDILNEPTPRSDARTGLGSWGKLVDDVTAAIRAHDTKHSIIVALPRHGSPYRKSIDPLALAGAPKINDSNVVYTTHFYEPSSFALHGDGIYPGVIDGETYNAAKLRELLKPTRDWQLANGNPPIYIGEFAPEKTADEASARAYLNDLIGIFEEYGWAWTFHTYFSGGTFDGKLNPAIKERLEYYWTLNPR